MGLEQVVPTPRPAGTGEAARIRFDWGLFLLRIQKCSVNQSRAIWNFVGELINKNKLFDFCQIVVRTL